jgi:hypothetical protein
MLPIISWIVADIPRLPIPPRLAKQKIEVSADHFEVVAPVQPNLAAGEKCTSPILTPNTVMCALPRERMFVNCIILNCGQAKDNTAVEVVVIFPDVITIHLLPMEPMPTLQLSEESDIHNDV